MKLFSKQITFKKVSQNDVSDVVIFLSKNFKKKISKVFYIQRYLTNFSKSYICLFDNKIVGHVGFVRYKLSRKKFNNKYIFSRHSSVIHPKFRNFGLFKAMCLYSISQIKSNPNNLGFVIWPNKTNYLRFENNFKINFNNNFLIELSNNHYQKKKPTKFTKKHIKNIKSYDNLGIINKDENYLKWRYFFKKDRSKYFINYYKSKRKTNSISIFDFNQKKQLRLLEFFGERKDYLNHINDLLRYRKNIIFFDKFYNKKGFQMRNKYQTIVYLFTKSAKKLFLKNKNLLTLGDTDSFIDYEKIK